MSAIPLNLHQTKPELRCEVNSILTKSVLQITGDTLKHFQAILPMNSQGDKMLNPEINRLTFLNDPLGLRKASQRRYNFSELQ